MRRNAWQKRLTTLVFLWLCLTVFGMAQAASTTHSVAYTVAVSVQYPAATDAQETVTPASAAEAQATVAPDAQQTDAADTAIPTDGVTIEPPQNTDALSTLPVTDATETPAATETLAVTATPAAPEALSIRSLYLEGAHRAAIGQTVTVKLALVVDNASGQPLSPFGVRIKTSPDVPCTVKDINSSDNVHFTNHTLLVENASAQGGRVAVDGETLQLSLSVTPFAEGSEETSVRLSIALLDKNGNEVGLQEVDQQNAHIDLTFQLRLSEQLAPDETMTDVETTAAPETQDTDMLPATDEMPQPNATDIQTLDLSVEPDATAGADALAADATTTTDAASTPTETPTPEPPAEERQLQLVASIPYDQLKVGDTLTLQAKLIGYDGLAQNIRIQWQQYTGGQWQNVQGATGDTLTLPITPDNLHSAWRYDVTTD